MRTAQKRFDVIKLFGAPFDPLDIAERVDVKLAYINWLKANQRDVDDFLDPYDFLEKNLKDQTTSIDEVEWIGQFPIASWLRPKPSISDLDTISQEAYTQFLDRNGCYQYYERLIGYLAREIRTAIPVMIGVDHCLSGAVLKYLKDSYGDYNVVIFDSHCDLIDLKTRRSYFYKLSPRLATQVGDKDVYECGSFLHYLLNERIINPERLWIIGAQDMERFKESSEELYSQKIVPWIERGLRILSKKDYLSYGIPEEIRGPTYISFDMDLGSMASVFAARFLNYVGLDVGQMRGLIVELSERINSKKIELVGLDIMEIDIHFLGESVEGRQDQAGELAKEIILRLIYDNCLH